MADNDHPPRSSNNHGSLCLSLTLSQPACLAAAGCGAKCVAAAMATCREARDAARGTHEVQKRVIEVRVHNHGTIQSLQDPSLPHLGPSNGIFVGGRDPTKELEEACEMVALMSVDATKGRVLFTVTLGCHNACPECFCTESDSFAVRALVRHLGTWSWVPVLTVYNLVTTTRRVDEVIAVASTSVERELNDALDLDDGQLGFVVRTLIEKSNVRHHGGKNPWSYMKAVHAWNKYRTHTLPDRWTFRETAGGLDFPPPPPPQEWSGIYPKRPRSLDGDALDDDMARCFPRGWTCAAPDDDLPEKCKKIVTYIDMPPPFSIPTSFCHSLVSGNTWPPLGARYNMELHWTCPRFMVLGVERLFIGYGPLADANGNGEPDARIFTTANFDELIAGWNREPPAEFEIFELLEAWRDDIIETRTVNAWAMVSRLEAHRGHTDEDDDFSEDFSEDEDVWVTV
ncbi:hypothetical protein RI054_32g127280 [Pseudoscourfieldia marina]